MSRYLEEAARVLLQAEKYAGSVDHYTEIAQGFAALAAVDKGLLPAEITQDVIAALLVRATV